MSCFKCLFFQHKAAVINHFQGLIIKTRQDKTRQDKVINHFQDQEDGGNINVYNKDNGNDNDEVDSYDDELSHALKSNFNQIN